MNNETVRQLAELHSFVRYFSSLSQKERCNKLISNSLALKAKELAAEYKFNYSDLKAS